MIVAGPDGALWFTEGQGQNVGIVGRITASGTITEFPLPTGVSASGITVGSDGALWFTEAVDNKIGRITTSGAATEYTIPTPGTYPLDITSSSDGTLWFTQPFGGSIGNITTSGSITEYSLSTYPYGITQGPDGAMWFSETTQNDIARYGEAVTSPATPAGLAVTSPAFGVPTLSWNSVFGATSYNIYRGGTLIGSSSSTNYVDNSITSDGSYTYTITAVGNQESSQSDGVTVMVDSTPPQVGTLSWSTNPAQQGQSTVLSVPVTDTQAGVTRVEFYVDSDPGQGNAAPMTLNGGVWAATFGANLAVNTYNIGVRAMDAAGNWSPVSTDVLAVYSAANGYVTGHEWVAPAGSDTLPIALDAPASPHQAPAKMVLGFTNLKAATSSTPTTGSFDTRYIVKQHQDEFDLSSTSVSWVVVPDSTHASIFGHADMTVYIGGVKTVHSNVAVRFDVVLGTSGAADHMVMKIWDTGVDPATAPSWVVDENASSSKVMIKP